MFFVPEIVSLPDFTFVSSIRFINQLIIELEGVTEHSGNTVIVILSFASTTGSVPAEFRKITLLALIIKSPLILSPVK